MNPGPGDGGNRTIVGPPNEQVPVVNGHEGRICDNTGQPELDPAGNPFEEMNPQDINHERDEIQPFMSDENPAFLDGDGGNEVDEEAGHVAVVQSPHHECGVWTWE